MAIRDLVLPLESNPGRFGQDGDPRLVNVFVEKRGTKDRAGKDMVAHYAVPGLVDWATAPLGGACRGLYAVDDSEMIAVCGNSVVTFDPFGNGTRIGGLLGTKPVTFARNLLTPTQIALVSQGQAKYIQSGVLADIPSPNLPPPNSCDFLAEYILFSCSDGSFWYSAINDVTTIDALSFYRADGKPDGLVRLKVFMNQIWLFGEASLEIWGLTQDAQNPFQRISGTFIDIGCASTTGVCELGTNLIWVADDNTVRMASGYSDVSVISTHAVSTAIEDLTDKTTIETSVVTIRGHQMLRLNSSDWTWIYDSSPGYSIWHEERSAGLTRRKAAYYARFAGKHITGDVSQGKLYTFDPAVGDDAGDPLMCTIRTAPQIVFPGDVEFNALYVTGVQGSGLNTPNDPVGLDPVVIERDSDDGGSTWSSEIAAPIGEQGKTTTRTVWSQLGTTGPDGRTFELRWDARANKAITKAAVDAVAVPP